MRGRRGHRSRFRVAQGCCDAFPRCLDVPAIARFAPPILLALGLAGCAAETTGGYPSLAPRAAEKIGFEEPQVAPAAPAAPDAALDAQIAAATVTLTEKARAFDAAERTASSRAAAARGAPAGSDAWLNAETALGDLDVIRADAGDPLATLEQLAIDRAAALAPPYPALDETLAAARARIEAMSARIAAIQAGLAR